MMMSNSKHDKNIQEGSISPINDFKYRFPWLLEKIVSFEERDNDIVFVNLSNGKTLLYNILTHDIKEVKRFNDILELTEDEWKKGFSYLLATYIELRGMTQHEFANRIGVSEVTISRYVKGKSLPSVYMLNKITSVLKCSQEDLLPKEYIFLD